MGRNRLDPGAAAEWLTKSKDLLMELINEILEAREANVRVSRRRKAKSVVIRKRKTAKSTSRAKRARS
jgi:hypothetical protein